MEPELRRDLATKTGCKVIEEPETPEGYKVPLWCDEHDAEWPCLEYQRVEAAVETEIAYWRERYEEMSMRYERLGRQYDARWSALARAWDDGARHGSRGVLSAAEREHRNPYRDDGKFPGREYGGNGQAGPGDELTKDRAEYWRLHHDMEGPVVDDAQQAPT